MKKILLIAGIIIIAAAGLFYWYQTTLASVGSLNIYSGSAEVIRSSKSIFGKTGLGVRAQDKIKVAPGSRISIILKDGSVIRLEAGTELQVADISYQGSTIKSAVFKITTGRIWAKPKPLAADATFKVETPSIEATVRGTSFDTDYLNQVNVEYVCQHQVDVNLAGKSDFKTVHQGEIFRIRDSNLQEDFDLGPVPATPADIDDWILFNQNEDKKLDSSIQDSAPSADSSNQSQNAPNSTTSLPTNTGGKTNTNTNSNSGNTNPAQTSTTPPPPAPAGSKLVSLSLTASSTTVTVGNSILLKVTGTYSDNSTASLSSSATYSQSPQIGSISSSGWFTGINAGTTTIYATVLGVVSNSIDLTVSKQLSSIRLSYVKQTQTAATYVGLPTVQYTATGVYSDGSTQDISKSVNWSATGTAGGVINSGGLYTPRTEGSATITSTSGNVTASSTITIP